MNNWKYIGVDFASNVDYGMEMMCEIKKSHIEMVDEKEIRVIDDMEILYCTVVPRRVVIEEN